MGQQTRMPNECARACSQLGQQGSALSGLHAARLVVVWLASMGTASGRSTPLVEVVQDGRLVEVGQAGQVRDCIQYGWVGGHTLRDLGGDQLPAARALKQQHISQGLQGQPCWVSHSSRPPGRCSSRCLHRHAARPAHKHGSSYCDH